MQHKNLLKPDFILYIKGNRAPELLLKERRYDTAIDMWTIGCVLGRSDQDQLDLIFKLCGTPTKKD
ncbi:3752_t:CDS:2 [Diversispora eburnea]|uniref:3752_t:CDS:1 n=2 Tax=Diversisporales TaxID=214509 RepID=A0A9N8YPT1_9GLOM|nr:3752_t:CDS:2 [Diversispora eburnea]